jgi:hypothetical protein
MRKSRMVLLAIAVVSTIIASTISVMMVRAPSPGFTIGTSTSSLNIPAGGCASKTITVTSINGFFGTVTLISTTSPASPGVSETITPVSLALTVNGTATSTKTVCASASTLPECQTETITGISGTEIHSITEQDSVGGGCAPPQQFTYTVKWICFVPLSPKQQPAAETIGLVPGEYKTDINVHNPSFANQTLNLKKKLVVSIPESPSVNATRVAFLSTVLGPDGAFFMSCPEILSKLGIPTIGVPVKGFLVIVTTTANLNVVVEYSSESLSPTGVSTGISLEVQTISAGPFVP